MQINSYYQNQWLRMMQMTSQGVSGTQQSAQTTTSTQSVSQIQAAGGTVNSDGDFFVPSGMQPPPPPPGNGAVGDVANFLGKVADGSVTSTDLSSMQSELKQVESTTGTTTFSTSGQTGFNADLASFMDKVTNGSVTSSDLSGMQTEIQQQVQAAVTAAQSAAANKQQTASDVDGFLQKVASGTATSDDLKSMQTELQNYVTQQNSSGASGTQSHHHHHHASAASTTDTTNSNTSSSSTSQSGNPYDLIAAYLTKVEQGTATADDTQGIQSTLQSLGIGTVNTQSTASA
ncbi:MAG: hypothetical protein P4N59_12480 [Negativicutes bacterium]|nr:hypothetical protein [Negativicutes bacterium]